MKALEDHIDVEVAQNILETVREVMKCFNCDGILDTPILNCRSGHNLCKTCHESVSLCPICSKELHKDCRNLELEKIRELCIEASKSFFEDAIVNGPKRRTK